MYITAYTALVEPIIGKLPVEESIESLYDHVDEFVVFDCSESDNLDLSKYGKVKKHVRGVWNPFDNPFGSMFTHALNLVESDTALFLDIDEIFEFKSSSLKDIVKRYDLSLFSGVSFRLINYFCDFNHILDGCQSKGPHVFSTEHRVVHDLLIGFWNPINNLRRVTKGPDTCDGVRLCDFNGHPMGHWPYVDSNEVVIHHTSHLDPIAKMVRSILQYNHTSTLDIASFVPYDMRISRDIVNKIYLKGYEQIKKGGFKLYGDPKPFEYKYNELLEKFVKRVGYTPFDPKKVIV